LKNKNLDIDTFKNHSDFIDYTIVEEIRDVLVAKVSYGQHIMRQAMIDDRMLCVLPENECEKARAAGFLAIEENEWKTRLAKAEAYEDENGVSIYNPHGTDYQVGISQGKLEIVNAVLEYRGRKSDDFSECNVISLTEVTSLSDIAPFEEGVLVDVYEYGIQIGRLMAMGCFLRDDLSELLT
jgi:hypothetical protein